jgi:hypothetical protein
LTALSLATLGLSSPSEENVPKFNKIKDLLQLVEGIEVVEPERPDECCGFGGMFSVEETAICAQMGWSWEFLHHGISWALVQRILADQARIVDGKEKKTVRLTEKNADEIIKQLLGG